MTKRVKFKSINDESLKRGYDSLQAALPHLIKALNALTPSEERNSLQNLATWLRDVLIEELHNELLHREVCFYCGCIHDNTLQSS